MHHGGHQSSRQEVGHHHREGHRQRQGREQEFRRAGQQQHRHEHDADGQRGNERGQRDLLGAIENGARQRLRHPHVAVDVFDFDRGVVHQDADRQRHAAQRHDVDGVAHAPTE